MNDVVDCERQNIEVEDLGPLDRHGAIQPNRKPRARKLHRVDVVLYIHYLPDLLEHLSRLLEPTFRYRRCQQKEPRIAVRGRE